MGYLFKWCIIMVCGIINIVMEGLWKKRLSLINQISH